jgi:hypothetical protein
MTSLNKMPNYRSTTEDKLGPLKSVIYLNNIYTKKFTVFVTRNTLRPQHRDRSVNGAYRNNRVDNHTTNVNFRDVSNSSFTKPRHFIPQNRISTSNVANKL